MDDGTSRSPDPDEPVDGENLYGHLTPDDLVVYERLSDVDFADHAFEVLATALVAYAHPVLSGWMATGEIHRQCAKIGWPVSPTDAEREYMYRHCDEVEGLVNETLGEALVLLRRGAGSGEHRWNRNGGASLTTYFVGTCVRTFPTVFRRWRGDLRRRPVTQSDSADECASHEFVSGYDVEGQVISEIFTRKRLDTIPPKVRRIVELRMEGFSYAEIAELTGARSSKAVEGVLQRYRDMLRRRGEGGQQ